jgi:hypothetical protein
MKVRDVRRIHPGRNGYFLHYRVHSGRVEVLALWRSSRLKGPALKQRKACAGLRARGIALLSEIGYRHRHDGNHHQAP